MPESRSKPKTGRKYNFKFESQCEMEKSGNRVKLLMPKFRAAS